MGDKCTRRCPFCDVGHGRPDPLDPDEPANLAHTIGALRLSYVVITSVDRDDLRDGGAGHFVACLKAIRAHSPATRIEILVPDFRGRKDLALSILTACPPDVMNHNIETVPRLYREARPGSDYAHSLALLKEFKSMHPGVPTKSGLMVGLGETDDEILAVMRGPARTPRRHAHPWSIPHAIGPSFASTPVCPSRDVQDVRGASVSYGICACSSRIDGQVELPCRRAGGGGVGDRASVGLSAAMSCKPWPPQRPSIRWRGAGLQLLALHRVGDVLGLADRQRHDGQGRVGGRA
ncbi:MAG: Lipoyl synthase [Massilia sp.]|nr:Lipoyl synthase [Massilia sp.]